jgi:hypothetical protein
MKDEQWYADEVSDTTMMTIAASLFGQKNKNINKKRWLQKQTISNLQIILM